MTTSGNIELNESTVFIPFNGYREVIESEAGKKILATLKQEGWIVPEPTVYRDLDNPNRDYLTILVHRVIN